MSANKTSSFNLKAVIQETGLTGDTLRAWERRYGLPMPERTPGGHRLYSQHDIDTIKWLKEKQVEGFSISRAVDLWNEIAQNNIDPLIAPHQTAIFSTPHLFQADIRLDTMRQQWVSACMAFNESVAEQTINKAFALNSPEIACQTILMNGLCEIGEKWYQGKATVQQEHFASALVGRRLNALINATAPPNRQEIILIGCPPKEQHTLIPLFLTFLLRRRGFHVVYLGANIPQFSFKETVFQIQPSMVILTGQQFQTAPALRDIAIELTTENIVVGYGGRIFSLLPELRNIIPGHFLGNDLNGSIIKIEQLLHNPHKVSETSPLVQKLLPYLQNFRTALPSIEKHLHETIGAHPELHSVPSQYLSEGILAALKLGDISLLNSDLDWVRGLLLNFKTPDHLLHDFLQFYYQAVDAVMGSQGAPILNWLQNKIDRIVENKLHEE